MTRKAEIFLDTSALFAGIWSTSGSARLLLKLGEAGAFQIVFSPEVLLEIERALRSKAPGLLPDLAVLLDRVGVQVCETAGKARRQACFQWTQHLGDAQVVADAWEAGIDYFVTLDRGHFLENQPLRQALPCLIGTPGDCIGWYRDLLVIP